MPRCISAAYLMSIRSRARFDTTQLDTHFHISRPTTLLSREDIVNQAIRNYTQIYNLLSNPDNIVAASVTQTQVFNRCSGALAPAWCGKGKPISVSPFFVEYLGVALGPNCRAAILIHEAAHNFGAGHRGGESGAAYDNSTPEIALDSAYVYPNFAEHVTPPFRDERFGLARPAI